MDNVGQESSSPVLTDAELVAEFVRIVKAEDMTQREAAMVSGLSQSSIAHWLKGQRSPLFPSTRRKLRAYLEGRAQQQPDGVSSEDEKEPPPADGERLSLGARLAAAEQQAAGDVVRLALAYDALAATIRGEAVLVEARAAETRALAIREAESASRFRNLATAAAPGLPGELSEEDARHLAALGAEMVRRARLVDEAARRDQELPPQRRVGGAG